MPAGNVTSSAGSSAAVHHRRTAIRRWCRNTPNPKNAA